MSSEAEPCTFEAFAVGKFVDKDLSSLYCTIPKAVVVKLGIHAGDIVKICVLSVAKPKVTDERGKRKSQSRRKGSAPIRT